MCFDRPSTECFGQRWRSGFWPIHGAARECHGGKCSEERGDSALLWMVGHHWQVRLTFEDLNRKHAQCSLWTNLDESTSSRFVHRLNLSSPFDRRRHLQS